MGFQVDRPLPSRFEIYSIGTGSDFSLLPRSQCYLELERISEKEYGAKVIVEAGHSTLYQQGAVQFISKIEVEQPALTGMTKDGIILQPVHPFLAIFAGAHLRFTLVDEKTMAVELIVLGQVLTTFVNRFSYSHFFHFGPRLLPKAV